mmetsp:Transcript_17888/g.54710  ORF Transcript_17888/g.54710 Transcript_17888/m.54710 type:complete len:424 (-) Transcript_17888:281-1552(-)
MAAAEPEIWPCERCRLAMSPPRTKAQCVEGGCLVEGRCFDEVCRHAFGGFAKETCVGCQNGKCSVRRSGKDPTCCSCRSSKRKEGNRAAEAKRRERVAATLSSARQMLVKTVDEVAVGAGIHAQSLTSEARVREKLRPDGGGANVTTGKPNVLLGSAAIGSTLETVVFKTFVSLLIDIPRFEEDLIAEIKTGVDSPNAPLTPIGYQDGQRNGCVFVADTEDNLETLRAADYDFYHGEDGCPFVPDWLPGGPLLCQLRTAIATWLSTETAARREAIGAEKKTFASSELKNVLVALPAAEATKADVDTTTLREVYGMHKDKDALFRDGGEWIVGVNLVGTAEITMAHGATLVPSLGKVTKKPNVTGFFQQVHHIARGEVYAMHHTVHHGVASSLDRLALIMRPLVHKKATRDATSRARRKRQWGE